MATAAGAVIYCRVSSDEQARGYSLPTQEESCRRYCADHGYTVVGVFYDAHSGTELDRPGLNAAIEAVATLKPAVVVLHDVDRLGREFIVQAIAERELTRHEARIEYVLGGNTDTGDGILLKGVKQALAVYENYQRVERSRRGKTGSAKAGNVLVAGRPPYGYQAVSGKRAGNLEPVPDEAEIVRHIFAWCVDERMTTYAIAKRLHEEGVPTRADTNPRVRKAAKRCYWDPAVVSAILKNETYTGVWHFGKTRIVKRGEKKVSVTRPREEWVAVPVPPIVDGETWERAQTQLVRNKQYATRNAKRDYLLRGRIFCRECGHRWVGQYTARGNRSHYRCCTAARGRKDLCLVNFRFRQAELESAVLSTIKTFLLDPEARAAGVTAERERLIIERERLTDDLATIDRHLASVNHKLEALLDQALTGDFPREMISKRKRDLLAERERRLRERERGLARLATTDVPNIESAIAALSPTVERAFAQATPEDLRQLLDVLRVEVHVVDRETVRLTGVVGGPEGSIAMPLAR